MTKMNRNMFFSFFKKNSSKGFTLVELLVVIAIIGILAAAVLIAVNPLEQVRKAQDQSLLSAANQYVGALNSYYAAKGGFPWTSGVGTCGTPTGVLSGTAGSCITTALIASGDLKQSSENQSSILPKLTLTSRTNANGIESTVICFKPQSNQMTTDKTKNVYAIDGQYCNGAGGTSACYTCAF